MYTYIYNISENLYVETWFNFDYTYWDEFVPAQKAACKIRLAGGAGVVGDCANDDWGTQPLNTCKWLDGNFLNRLYGTSPRFADLDSDGDLYHSLD